MYNNLHTTEIGVDMNDNRSYTHNLFKQYALRGPLHSKAKLLEQEHEVWFKSIIILSAMIYNYNAIRKHTSIGTDVYFLV